MAMAEMNPFECVWVGAKVCGCVVAAGIDSGTDKPADRSARRERDKWLDSGLRVFKVSPVEFKRDYLPRMFECPHDAARERTEE